MRYVPELICIGVLQGGLTAVGLGLLRWEWWLITFASIAYALAAGIRARDECLREGHSE